MIPSLPSRPRNLSVVLLLSIYSLCLTSLNGQEQGQYDKGTPPQFSAGVSALGSYASADAGTVNLSNGALNLRIPIASVGGRGFSLPLTLNYSSKIWSAKTDTEQDAGQTYTVAYSDFANIDDYVGYFERISAGWSIGATPMLFNRIVNINRLTSGPWVNCPTFKLAKLTLMMPDKGEIELRDDYYDGAPLPYNCATGAIASRGRRWHATDGSGIVYISDGENAAALQFGDLSGIVITADGTRYHFSGDFCDSITDRNGNKITISYSGTGLDFTDQLGRVTRIQQDVADPQNPTNAIKVLVTVPGYNGPRYYKIKTAIMNQRYRSDIAPSLPVITGDYDPLSKGYNDWWGSPTRLFQLSYGLYAQRIDNLPVVSELILPDNRSMYFRYNQFGEVAEVQLPTGGKVWYDYGDEVTLPTGNSPGFQTGGDLHTTVQVDRALIQRRTFPDGSALEASWAYSYGWDSTVVQAFSSGGSLVLDQRHFFMAAGQYYDYPSGTPAAHDGTHNMLWSTAIEWRTETRNASGAVLTAREEDWTQRAPVSWSTYPQEQPAKDNRANQARKFLDTGAFAKVDTLYDLFSNPIEVKEYDYDQTLKRRSTISYVVTNNGYNYTTDDSIHLLRLPAVQTVYDGGGAQVAQTVSEYDVYSGDGNHAALTDYNPVSQHDPTYGLEKITRGNLTRVGRWLNTTGGFIYSYPRYDTLGNVVSAKDANGNVTTIYFEDDFGDGSNPGSHANNPATPTYALPTYIISPPPTPGAPVHTARTQYDFSTGLLTGFRDRNNIVTQTLYNDPFNRPTVVKSALGVALVENHAAIFYAPTNAYGLTLTSNDVLQVKDLSTVDDAQLRSWTKTDGYGRTKEAWSKDPQGDVKVMTNYDALGRAFQTSNPFRPSLGESPVYTTTAYDFAGRMTTVTTPDNAVVKSSYSGTRVLVADQNPSDQNRKKRISVSDAQGRLKEVWEVTAADSATESVSFPNWPDVTAGYRTKYEHDVLDNLTSITQRIGTSGTTQTRTFVYDSLKRLTSATNPESGTITYQYDNNGNLTKKTDARGVYIDYVYDALNRNTTVDYSDTTSINPDVTRIYDTATNGKGRLRESYAGGNETSGANVEHTKIQSYDAPGRPEDQRQRFKSNSVWSGEYQTQRGYNLAGGVTSQTYPSGHTVNYNYDQAGRLADNGQNLAVTGNLGDGVTRTYSRGIIYSPLGGMSQEQFGTDTAIYNKLFYNSRHQLAEIRVGTTANDEGWNRGAIINHYSNQCWGKCAGSSMTDNNGNLKRQDNYIPSNEQISSYQAYVDWFAYDNLNRLLSVNEELYAETVTNTLRQTYIYDRYGNRRIDTNPSQTFGGINNLGFEVETVVATNRLYAPGDLALPDASRRMRYDSAGNLTTDTYTGAGSRTYDAENRMTKAWGGNNQWQEYTYNADGRRVKRKINNQETWQIYGIDGELLSEYAANAAPASPQKEYGYRNGQLLITAGSTTTATFVKTDTTTQGNWKGVYGAQGYNIINDATSYPAYAQVSVTGQSPFTWSASTSETRALLKAASSSDRLAACWYSGSDFSIDINLTDGQEHQIALYALDWDSCGPRSQRLDVIDATTNAILDSRSLSAFVNGTYLVWKVSGHVIIRVTNLSCNAVISGVFFDSNNLALNKPATQSSTHAPGTTDAGKAVDGNTDGVLWNGYASATNYNNNAWWQVDLQSVQALSSVQIWGRTDCCSEMTTNFYVFVSDNPFTSYDLNTTLNQPGVSNYYVPGYSGSPGTISVNRTGRYVRVQFAGSQYLVLGEVKVFSLASGSGAGGIQWLVSDHLGTPRIILDKTGSLANVKRHDYLPFGEELFAGQGGRTPTLGYTGDNVRQKFTSKERDNETGLDYFGARYYASVQGRFTGVDIAGPNLSDPQSLNKYAYTLNNPLRYIDRNGLYEEDVHHHLTQALAEAAGFSRSQAWEIAMGNQMTDETPGMSPYSSIEARRNYHFTTEGQRQNLWNNFAESAAGVSSETTTLGSLGVFMHAQQDSYSHAGYGPVLGHGMAGHAPDKTYNNPGKADRMALDSFNRLTTAATVLYDNKKISFLYKPLDQKTLKPLVQSFNRAKTPEEKMKIVTQIKTLARENIQRQAEEAIRKKQEEEKRKRQTQ